MACESDEQFARDDAYSKESNVNLRSLADALECADLMYESLYGKTRGTSGVDNVEFVSLPQDSDTEAGSPGCYLVNYDNGGFAILSADKRVTPVLGISDEGSISASDTVSNSGLS